MIEVIERQVTNQLLCFVPFYQQSQSESEMFIVHNKQYLENKINFFSLGDRGLDSVHYVQIWSRSPYQDSHNWHDLLTFKKRFNSAFQINLARQSMSLLRYKSCHLELRTVNAVGPDITLSRYRDITSSIRQTVWNSILSFILNLLGDQCDQNDIMPLNGMITQTNEKKKKEFDVADSYNMFSSTNKRKNKLINEIKGSKMGQSNH